MSGWLAFLIILGVWGTAYEIRTLAKQLAGIDGLLREIRTHLDRLEDPAFSSPLGTAYADLKAIRRQVVKPGAFEQLAED